MLKTIKRTTIKDCRKDLTRINLLATGFVFICSLFFLLLFEDRKVVVVITLKSAGYILMISFLQMYLLDFCVSRYSERPLLFRLWRYFVTYIVGIWLYLLFWHVFGSYAGILSRSNDTKWQLTYSGIAIILNSVIMILHDFTIARRIKIQTDLEYERLQTKNKEAENLLLKQQIQPHFLFNALSTLKSPISTDPDKSESYLMQLAEFLRVSVSHNKSFTATLAEELAVCNNYLEMQKIRFGDALYWEINIKDKRKTDGLIPSLSLQPLLENAIKHNILTTENPLKISIIQHDHIIEVSNNINLKLYGDGSTKSGLSNLAERYYLLTGEEIRIVNDGKIFSVSFNIINNESSHN